MRTRIFQILAYTLLLAATPLMAVYYQATMRDPDIWWHLRVGESILNGQGFPHTAVFSRFAQTNAWSAYSWIFEVVMALVYRWLSIPSLPVFFFIFQIVIGGTLLWAAVRISRSAFYGGVLAAIALAAFFYTLAPRPVLFTVLFFIVEMMMIFYDLRERCVHALFWLPLLFVVWANCHIQFVTGLLLLGLLCGCEFLQHAMAANVAKASPDLQWTKLALIFAGCLLATLIGPYSWHLYGVVWGYVSHPAQWDQIIELTAPSFRRPAHFVELLLAVASAFALGVRETRSLFRIALVAVAAVISFHATRDSWMISIVAVFICGEALAQDLRIKRSTPASPSTIALSGALALVVCMFAQFEAGNSTGALIEVLDQMYPVRAASFVAETHPAGPLYNSVNWGGYLIYNLREYPVSVDGRSDAYGGTFSDSLRVEQGLPGWKQDPTFNASNVVLIEKSLPLAQLLKVDPDFRMIYEDHLAMVFVRKNR